MNNALGKFFQILQKRMRGEPQEAHVSDDFHSAGTSVDQDGRFSDKEKKLMKKLVFEPVLSTKVNMKKVQLDTIKPWISKRVSDILSFEDEVVIQYIYELLETNNVPNPQKMQMQIAAFLQAYNARIFMKELWELLVNAQSNPSGIPDVFIKQKKDELHRRKEQIGDQEVTLKEIEAISLKVAKLVPESLQRNNCRNSPPTPQHRSRKPPVVLNEQEDSFSEEEFPRKENPTKPPETSPPQTHNKTEKDTEDKSSSPSSSSESSPVNRGDNREWARKHSADKESPRRKKRLSPSRNEDRHRVATGPHSPRQKDINKKELLSTSSHQRPRDKRHGTDLPSSLSRRVERSGSPDRHSSHKHKSRRRNRTPERSYRSEPSRSLRSPKRRDRRSISPTKATKKRRRSHASPSRGHRSRRDRSHSPKKWPRHGPLPDYNERSYRYSTAASSSSSPKTRLAPLPKRDSAADSRKRHSISPPVTQIKNKNESKLQSLDSEAILRQQAIESMEKKARLKRFATENPVNDDLKDGKGSRH